MDQWSLERFLQTSFGRDKNNLFHFLHFLSCNLHQSPDKSVKKLRSRWEQTRPLYNTGPCYKKEGSRNLKSAVILGFRISSQAVCGLCSDSKDTWGCCSYGFAVSWSFRDLYGKPDHANWQTSSSDRVSRGQQFLHAFNFCSSQKV